MIGTVLFALPLAAIWVIVTGHAALDSFLVGWVVGFVILLSTGVRDDRVNWGKLIGQLLASTVYTITLCRDIWLSTLDVTKRVLDPKLPLNPGIVRVSTQDEHDDEVISAFSAHGITITPGELVVDYDDQDGMFVHCLDVEASSQNAPAAQTKRLRMLRRVLGH